MYKKKCQDIEIKKIEKNKITLWYLSLLGSGLKKWTHICDKSIKINYKNLCRRQTSCPLCSLWLNIKTSKMFKTRSKTNVIPIYIFSAK